MKLKNEEIAATEDNTDYGEVLSTIAAIAIAGIGLAFLIGIVTLYGAFWEALVGWRMWQWFVVPLGFPEINGWHVAGLGLFIGMLRYNSRKAEPIKDWKKQITEWIAYPPLMAGIFLFIGFLVAHMANLA